MDSKAAIKVEAGRTYEVDHDGKQYRVVAKKRSAMIPGWWICDPLMPEGPTMVPDDGFIRLVPDE